MTATPLIATQLFHLTRTHFSRRGRAVGGILVQQPQDQRIQPAGQVGP